MTIDPWCVFPFQLGSAFWRWPVVEPSALLVHTFAVFEQKWQGNEGLAGFLWSGLVAEDPEACLTCSLYDILSSDIFPVGSICLGSGTLSSKVQGSHSEEQRCSSHSENTTNHLCFALPVGALADSARNQLRSHSYPKFDLYGDLWIMDYRVSYGSWRVFQSSSWHAVHGTLCILSC